jgi:hypothetical protein
MLFRAGQVNYEQTAQIHSNTVKTLLHNVFVWQKQATSLFSQIYLLIYISISVQKTSFLWNHMGNRTKGAYEPCQK